MKSAALIILAMIFPAQATVPVAPPTVLVSVAAHVIDRGAIVSEGDLELIDSQKLGNRTGLASREHILGKEVKRTIAQGQPFYTNDLKIPDLVKRDELVTMLVSRAGFSIAAAGKALEDGARGQNIRVQNITSKQIIEGRVTSPGTVVITPLGSSPATDQN